MVQQNMGFVFKTLFLLMKGGRRPCLPMIYYLHKLPLGMKTNIVIKEESLLRRITFSFNFSSFVIFAIIKVDFFKK
jgi:hypothetical protein